MSSFVSRWAVFVRERFPPWAHLPAIGAFVAANAALGTGGLPDGAHLAALLGATVLVFLRMRIFDELKDHATDVRLHPERPLARGLVSPAEARRVAFALVPAEGVLAWICGTEALAVWAAVLVWTLLMYREFFVGAWLRPRMELYAVTHTFVVTGLGLLAAVAGRGAPTEPHAGLVALAAANWAVFNVFEFARKTTAPEEERPGAETYSSRHGPRGALLLTAGNVLVACAALAFGGVLPRTGLCAAAAAALLPLFGTVPFALRPAAATARWFRGCHGAFLVAFYVAALTGAWAERAA